MKLGNPRNLTQKARRKGNSLSYTVRAAQAAQRAQDLAPILAEIQAEGAPSLRGIASALNARGIPAPRKGIWSAVQVRRVLTKLNEAA